MSCWRVLEISSQDAGDTYIPQLLVKPVFESASYIVHVTDLSNIWSEALDINSIVDRAFFEQSPIEVSKQDTTQLAILLGNVQRSLTGSDNATCRITRTDSDGLMLHTSIDLPAPLDSLTWKFRLQKQTAVALKNELILPLLISSHIQNERISGLIKTITSKDRAIIRLVDQYESSSLDLAAAFPSIGSLKTGRKLIKHEQATKYVPALQPFQPDEWKRETGQLADLEVTTLGLFQGALRDCTPNVPQELKDDGRDESWWSDVPIRLPSVESLPKVQAKPSAASVQSFQRIDNSNGSAIDDDFETHKQPETRNVPALKGRSGMIVVETLSALPEQRDEETTDEDDDDLDEPIKRQIPNQNTSPFPSQVKSSTPLPSSPMLEDSPPAPRPKDKGFRIGGRSRRMATASPPPATSTDKIGLSKISDSDTPASSLVQRDSLQKPRRPFKIGGKNRNAHIGESQAAHEMNHVVEVEGPKGSLLMAPSSPPPSASVKLQPSPSAGIEETAEQKAARRRAELKRRNEEAAKKSAQSKKKKRF